MRVIAYQTPEGVAVIWPNPKNREAGESEDDHLRRVWARNVQTAAQIGVGGAVFNPHLTSGTPHIIIDSASLPSRDKRDQWRIAGGQVVV